MKAKILKKSFLKDIPSASGIEVVNGLIYIISDDTPFLYCFDHHLNLKEKIHLYEQEDFDGNRIPKSIKADIESLTSLTFNNNKYLLALGSGSMNTRDRGFLIKLPTKFNKKHFTKEVDFKIFYNLLRSNPDIVGNGVLNIEGSATSESNLFLFQRLNNNSNSICLAYSLEEIEVFLMENPKFIPFPRVISYSLPQLNNIKAGFSGACFYEDLMFVTATLENTNDAIADGEIFGSYIGIIKNLEQFSKKGEEGIPTILDDMVLLQDGEETYLGKIESINIYEKEAESFFAIAVTDNDLGHSELLMLEIIL